MEQVLPNILYFVSKRCDSQWNLKKEKLWFYDLTFIMEGEAVYRVDDVPYLCRAGDAIFIPAGKYREATTTGMTCCAFNFLCGNGVELPEKSQISWQNSSQISNILQEYNREWLAKGPYFELKCNGLFLTLLAELLRGKSAFINPHVERMKQFILDHLTEPYSLEDLARQMGLNSVYCGALFKKTTGLTVNAYRNQIRVQMAAALLEHEPLNVSQVAFQTGFEDVYYFSKVFKQMKGISPLLYRKTVANR